MTKVKDMITRGPRALRLKIATRLLALSKQKLLKFQLLLLQQSPSCRTTWWVANWDNFHPKKKKKKSLI